MAKNRLGLTALILFATMIWGLTFPVVKDAVRGYPVEAFLGIRFALGAVVLAPFAWRRMRRRTVLVGLGIGLVLGAAYYFQTLGLRYTQATNCGLVTGLFVVFAPLTGLLLFGKRPTNVVWVAVGLALAGLYFLEGAQWSDLQSLFQSEAALGAILVFVGAFGFGLHITLLGRFSAEHDAIALTTCQLAAVAVVFLAWSIGAGTLDAPTTANWGRIALTGVMASAVCFGIQTFVQQHLPPSRVAVILCMEPVFATIFGRLLHSDQLAGEQWFGALLIVVGMLVCETMSGSDETQQGREVSS